MNERLKKLRKTLDLTQQKFADRLGVKRNTVGQWECGINAITDQVVFSICREFDVNEEWLRTGEGEMFIRKTRSETIADFMVDMLNEEEPSYKRRLIEALAELSTDEWKLLENITLKLAEKKD